jgi:hypothetical protein
MNVKELFENEELMNNIVEDLEDLPEDAEVRYEVWALGSDLEYEPTEDEYLIGEFDNPDEAIKCAEEFTKETFYTEYEKPINPNTFHISIEVETVVEDLEDEDGGTMNIGTVFQKTIYLTSHNDFIEPIYFLMPHNDYEVLEDNTLKIKRKPLLADVNKNDIIEVAICDTPEAALHPTVLKYKVVSKVIYEDGDYYHCELLI